MRSERVGDGEREMRNGGRIQRLREGNEERREEPEPGSIEDKKRIGGEV